MGANDPRGVANLDLRGIIGRVYVGTTTKHCYMLNIQTPGLMVSEKNILCISYFKHMADNNTP